MVVGRRDGVMKVGGGSEGWESGSDFRLLGVGMVQRDGRVGVRGVTFE